MDQATITAFVENFYATDVNFPGSLGSTRGATSTKRSQNPTHKKKASAKVVKKLGVTAPEAPKPIATRHQLSR